MTDTALVDSPGRELPGHELMVSVLDTFTFRAVVSSGYAITNPVTVAVR